MKTERVNKLKIRKAWKISITITVMSAAMTCIGCGRNEAAVNGSSNKEYTPVLWVDYSMSHELSQQGDVVELTLEEYPDTTFSFTSEREVRAKVRKITGPAEETTILGGGMTFVENIYLADLTGDGLPEFCATALVGSGIVDSRILVYDYAADKTYDLNDRFTYDYELYLEDELLMVRQYDFNVFNGGQASGKLIIEDDILTAVGVDRTVK